MKKEEEIIAEMLASGEYYQEGLKWYNSRYIRPKTQLVHMSIFAFIALGFFLITLVTFSRIFPLTDHVGFTIERNFDKKEVLRIKSIGNAEKNATLGVLNFYISEYVKSREEFIEDNINRNFKFVTEISNDAVFDEFMYETDISNPENPIYTLGRQVQRKIKVLGLKLPPLPIEGMQINSDIIYNAQVKYLETLVYLDGTEEFNERLANVSFKYKEIIVDQQTHDIKQLPEVVITDYKTREL